MLWLLTGVLEVRAVLSFLLTAPGHPPLSCLLEHYAQGPGLVLSNPTYPLPGMRWKNTDLRLEDQGPQSDQVSLSDPGQVMGKAR